MLCDVLHPSLCPVKKLPRNTPTSQQAGLRGRELHVRDTEVHKQVRGRGWKVVERNVPKMSTLTVKGSGEERGGERWREGVGKGGRW